METPDKNKQDKWVTVYSREGERSFFFYATIVIALVFIAQKLLHLW